MAKEDKKQTSIDVPGKEDKLEEGPVFDDNKMLETFDGFKKMRELVNSIPTPGRDEGDTLGDFSLFAVFKDTANAALDLMEMPQTGRITPEAVFDAALDIAPAGNVAAMKTMPRNALGMFGSRPGFGASPEIHTKWADYQNMAKRMEADGLSPELIHNKTGMSKDNRGDWRYEVHDQDVQVNTEAWKRFTAGREDKRKGLDAFIKTGKMRYLDAYKKSPDTQEDMKSTGIPLGELLHSPKVFEHWPELKEVRVTNKGGDYVGAYNRLDQTIDLNLNVLLRPDAPSHLVAKVLVHEMQHALQHLQYRRGGSNLSNADNDMRRALLVIDKYVASKEKQGEPLSLEQLAVFQKAQDMNELWTTMSELMGGPEYAAYKAHPGEIEARLADALVNNPDLGVLHPDASERRIGSVVPLKERELDPEQLRWPRDETPPDTRVGRFSGKPLDTQSGGSETQAGIPDAPDPLAGLGDLSHIPESGQSLIRNHQALITQADATIQQDMELIRILQERIDKPSNKGKTERLERDQDMIEGVLNRIERQRAAIQESEGYIDQVLKMHQKE